MASPTEVAAMRRALDLARTTGVPPTPNPRVGCVLLGAEGQVVGEGFGRGAGRRHAEADALLEAGELARDATAVVTLEPCNHSGRTGPCSAALLAAGVGRLVYAQADRNPVARGGAETLRAAGVDVEGGVLAEEARSVNPQFTASMEMQRPYVTWKLATTLDGRSAAADGTSRWITGPAARRDVHRQRELHDVVLVGTGTVRADDPRLTVRDEHDRPVDRRFQPLRAVMGRSELPAGCRVLDDAAPTVHLRTREPTHALAQLYAANRQFVWLEGGPTLAAAFLAAGLVDRVVAYVAPALLGGGLPAVCDFGVRTVGDAFRLVPDDVTRLGDDVRITATVSREV
jgi:diaminohydroxyphosphoribosylaminopyrimidine deaminase / 5-amino-6-(5-phosphoribosylamino)uracil reductase